MSRHMEFNGRILTVADGHDGRVSLMIGGGNNHAAVGVSVPATKKWLIVIGITALWVGAIATMVVLA